MEKQVVVVLASIVLLFEQADMDRSWDVRAPLLRLSVTAGEPASLVCRSPPPGRITWFRERANSFPNEIKNNKRTTTDSKGTLHFSYVQGNDTGVFQCGVSEGSSVKMGSKVNLTVQTSTDESVNVKPKVVFHSGVIRSDLGENIKLECIFSGRPPPIITWTHSNEILVSAGRVLVAHNSVVISNVTEADRGIYTCTGENVAGTAAIRVTVDVPQTSSTDVSDTGSVVTLTVAVIVLVLGGVVLGVLLWRKMKTKLRKQENRLSSAEQQEIEDFVVKHDRIHQNI